MLFRRRLADASVSISAVFGLHTGGVRVQPFFPGLSRDACPLFVFKRRQRRGFFHLCPFGSAQRESRRMQGRMERVGAMKRAAAVLAVLLFLGTVWAVFPVWGAEGTEKNKEIQRVEEIADRIIQWKKENEGNEKEGFFSDSFLCSAGTTLADWYVLGLSRSGAEEDYASYRFALARAVEERYKTSGRLESLQGNRVAPDSTLSMLASGGNPKKAGIRGQIDLVADGIYDRADNEGNGILGKQGINGYIWGLIALDSCFYAVPEEAFYTREELLLNILNRQNADGGWSLSGDRSDVDMTAMALQALAPYKNSEQVYSYQNKKLYPDGKTVEKKGYTCIEEALCFLSEEQQEDGGYASEGIPNSESTAQVLLALCALGMDPPQRKRFHKKRKYGFRGNSEVPQRRRRLSALLGRFFGESSVLGCPLRRYGRRSGSERPYRTSAAVEGSAAALRFQTGAKPAAPGTNRSGRGGDRSSDRRILF